MTGLAAATGAVRRTRPGSPDGEAAARLTYRLLSEQCRQASPSTRSAETAAEVSFGAGTFAPVCGPGPVCAQPRDAAAEAFPSRR